MKSAFLGITPKKGYGQKKVTAQDSFSELMKQADVVFAKWIKRGRPFVQCYTCEAAVRVAVADVGHYIDRRHYPTRYNEQNIRCQCQNCNRLLDGNKEIFRERLIAELGESAVIQLEASRHSLMKFSKNDLLEIINKYKI